MTRVRHSMVKLTERQVLEIRAARKRGATVVDLGKRYGINWSHVSKIVKRKAWDHI